jgi:hypothetical protein
MTGGGGDAAAAIIIGLNFSPESFAFDVQAERSARTDEPELDHSH